jgi:hypothetical protein
MGRKAGFAGGEGLERRALPALLPIMDSAWYTDSMTVEDLERAVSELPPDQLAKLREWFEAFDGTRFDQKIVRDAKFDKLDRLADQAIDDFCKGRAREL